MKHEINYDWNDKDNLDEPVDGDDKEYNIMKKAPKKVEKKSRKREKRTRRGS